VSAVTRGEPDVYSEQENRWRRDLEEYIPEEDFEEDSTLRTIEGDWLDDPPQERFWPIMNTLW
jgi:hypothetical protein